MEYHTPLPVIEVEAFQATPGPRIIAGLPFRTAVAFALLFAVAIWLYGVMWSKAPIMVPDSPGYLRAAHSLTALHFDQLQDRAPGYPLLLALTAASRHPRVLFFVSLLLHCVSIWLLACVLYSAGLKGVSLNLFALVLLLPPYAEKAGYVLSEGLAEAILATAFASFVYWFLRRRMMWLVISAAAVGCAALTRPAYQVLALGIAAFLFVARMVMPKIGVTWGDVARASSILVFGSIVIVGGYAFENYRKFGYFGVTPKFGLTLSTRTVRVVERLPDDYAAMRETLTKARDAELVKDPSHTGQMYIWGVAPELTNGDISEQVRLSGYMLRLNLLLIKAAPLTYLQEVLWAFVSYWFPASGELANLNSRFIQSLWAVSHFFLVGAFAINLILLLGAATYIKSCWRLVQRGDSSLSTRLKLIRSQGFIYGLAGTIVFYTAAVSCVIEVGDPRYRVPTDGLIIFMLFLGLLLWRRLIDLPESYFSGTERIIS